MWNKKQVRIVDSMMHMQVPLFFVLANMFRVSVTKLSSKALRCQNKMLVDAE